MYPATFFAQIEDSQPLNLEVIIQAQQICSLSGGALRFAPFLTRNSPVSC